MRVSQRSGSGFVGSAIADRLKLGSTRWDRRLPAQKRIHERIRLEQPWESERTTTVADFWDSLLRLEGLWNSPLRVQILRVVATGAFFILGVLAGRLWGKWRRFRQLKTAERGVSDDVVTIEKILLDRRPDGTLVMRIRSCGGDPIATG